MNKSFKVLALFLAVMMCMSIMPLTSLAAGTNAKGVTFSATLNTPTISPSASAQQVVMTVSANQKFPIDAIGMTVTIPEGWTLESIENEDLGFTSSNLNLAKGKVNYATPDAENWMTDLVAKVTYNVPAGAAAGTYTLGVSALTISEDYGTEWESNGSASVTLTIASAPKTLTGIAVTKAPTKTTYTAGENFDKTGMEVTATYSDSSTAKVTTYTVTDGTALTAGKTSVTVSYTEGGVTKTATQAITVNAAITYTYTATLNKTTITSSATAQQVVMTVKANAKFPVDAIGMTVLIPTGWTLAAIENSELGFAASNVNLANGKVNYATPDAENWMTDLVVTVTYNVPANVTAGTYALGIKGMTISKDYGTEWESDGSANVSLTVNAAPKTLTGIAVTKAPTKTTYTAGENFDKTGMEVTATYSDSSTAKVTTYTVTDGTALTAGKTSVTVSYTEGGVTKTATQAITVNAPAPITYTVSFNANGGTGTMTAQTVAAGSQFTLPANGFTAPAGKQFKAWSVNGSIAAPGTKITVTSNTVVTAIWETVSTPSDDWYWALVMLYSQKFDITASADEGGVITPAGVTKVQYSKSITYTITPAAGYAIKSVLVDGKDAGAVSSYTFKNVTKKHTIHAIFEAVNPYTDVKADDWFYEDVLYVTASGLMEGTGDKKFSPAITTDRAMLVTVLWRLEGSPVVKSDVKFNDVKDGQWYTNAINWASANDIV